jgi:hypothetical protein
MYKKYYIPNEPKNRKYEDINLRNTEYQQNTAENLPSSLLPYENVISSTLTTSQYIRNKIPSNLNKVQSQLKKKNLKMTE